MRILSSILQPSLDKPNGAPNFPNPRRPDVQILPAFIIILFFSKQLLHTANIAF